MQREASFGSLFVTVYSMMWDSRHFCPLPTLYTPPPPPPPTSYVCDGMLKFTTLPPSSPHFPPFVCSNLSYAFFKSFQKPSTTRTSCALLTLPSLCRQGCGWGLLKDGVKNIEKILRVKWSILLVLNRFFLRCMYYSVSLCSIPVK